MARYVVFSFEDNKEANEFVDMIEDKGRITVTMPRGDGYAGGESKLFAGAKLVALTMKPTMFCDPSDGHRGRRLEAGWLKGIKWGLWVCGKCGKPSRRWGSAYQAVIGSAKNLLEEDAPDPKRLTDQERVLVARGGKIDTSSPPPGYSQDSE